MEDEVLWMVVALSVAMAVGTGVVFALLKPSGRAAQKRKAMMRELAGDLGMRYLGAAEGRALDYLPDFSLLEKGYGRALSNLMADPDMPPKALLFDYECVHSADDLTERPSETDVPGLYLVAIVRFPDWVDVTPARVYPWGWLGGPVGVTGLYRLDLPGEDDFCERHVIWGEPREAIAGMLDDGVRQAISGWAGRGMRPTVEILDGWVVAHVESQVSDGRAASTAAALVGYAGSVAAALEMAAHTARLGGSG